jgi:MSHA biogenesis protein MshN
VSVINDMLRDLNDRQTRNERMLTDLRPAARRMVSRGVFFVLVPASVLALLATWLVWLQRPGEEVTRSATLPRTVSQQEGAGAVVRPEVLVADEDQIRADARAAPELAPDSVKDIPPATQVATLESPQEPVSPEAARGAARAATSQNSAADPQPAQSASVAKVRSEPEPAAQAQARLAAAAAALRRRDLQAAEQAARAAVRLAPEDTRGWEMLYAILERAGRDAEAELVLTQGLGAAGQPAGLARLQARRLLEAGDRVAALAALERYRPTAPRDIEHDAFIAALKQQTGRYGESATLYQELLVLRPDNGVWWVGLGISRDKLGETAAAIEAYSEARERGGLSQAVDNYAAARIRALTRTDQTAGG